MTTTTALTPADVLRGAADWFAEDPTRWGRDYFINPADGCRCLLGGITQVLAPRDLDGNPTALLDYETTELGTWVTGLLADYLVDHHDAPLSKYPNSAMDAVETVANWNDEAGRTAADVISALRGAADEWDARQAARLARVAS